MVRGVSGAPGAEEFSKVLRRIRADKKLTLEAVKDAANIAQPQLSNYLSGRARPQLSTFERLVAGLTRLGVPEDRLVELKTAWEGKPAESAEPQTPPDAHSTRDAKAEEPTPPTPTAIPTPAAPPARASMAEQEDGTWVLTAPIPKEFPVERLGEILAAVRRVIATYVNSESGS